MCTLREKKPIGLIVLGHHQDEGAYEISYQFDPTFWGKGLAGEAVQAVLAHAKARKIERVVAETQSANAASCSLLRKQGMVEVRRVRRFGADQIIFATK